jgi:hypothetical protein
MQLRRLSPMEIPTILNGLARESAIFDAVGASAVGPRHLTIGKPCEDEFDIKLGPDWVIAVVSDGAGSASRGLEGAKFVSKEICRSFMDRLQAEPSRDNLQSMFPAWVESGVCEGIERARTGCRLEMYAGGSLADFHATVVGIVMVGEQGALFHIGDGCASAFRYADSGIETIAFSEPENGEYVNETFFFTEDWWREHLRITHIPGLADEVWVMTDGAYELVVPPGKTHLREFTVSEIDKLVFCEPTDNRSSVLREILSCSQANRNGDDKTIVIIRRSQPNE